MKPSPKEIENVIQLDPFDRYRHFFKRVADTELLYSLCDNRGNFAHSKIESHLLIPLWPFEEYANLCKTHEWEQYLVTKISLSVFESEVIPIIQKGNYLLNIFPANLKTGFVVTLDEFTKDLNEELENYQD